MKTDIKRTLQGTIDFNSFLREYAPILPTADAEDVQDILLQCYAQPTVIPVPLDQSLVGMEDLRLYIRGVSCTAALINEIARSLAAIDAGQLRAQYRAGAEPFLRYVEQQADDFTFKADTTYFQNFVKTDLAASFTKLGDRTFGRAGTLHLLNFIYRYISVPPVSLQRVFSAALAAAGKPEQPLAGIKSSDILFSQGPPPSLEPFSKDFWPRGRLVYSLELIYRNPLADLLKEISAKVTVLRQRIEQQRVQYLAPIKDDLETTNIDFTHRLEGVKTAVEKLDQSVQAINPQA